MPPSVNHYLEHYCERSTTGDIHRIKVRVTERAARYKHDTGWLVKQARVRVEDTADMRLEAHVYQGSHGIDLDNVLKVLIDSLKDIAYADDRQVAEIFIKRHLSRGKGRIDLLITKLEPEPIEEATNENATETMAETNRHLG